MKMVIPCEWLRRCNSVLIKLKASNTEHKGALFYKFANRFYKKFKSLVEISVTRKVSDVKRCVFLLTQIVVLLTDVLAEIPLDITSFVTDVIHSYIDFILLQSSFTKCEGIDVLDTLSRLEDYHRGSALDVILKCKTIRIPDLRKFWEFLPSIRYVVSRYKKQRASDDIPSFLKLLLLYKLVMIEARKRRSAELQMIKNEFRGILFVPAKFDLWAESRLCLCIGPDETPKSIAKRLDSKAVLKVLYPSRPSWTTVREEETTVESAVPIPISASRERREPNCSGRILNRLPEGDSSWTVTAIESTATASTPSSDPSWTTSPIPRPRSVERKFADSEEVGQTSKLQAVVRGPSVRRRQNVEKTNAKKLPSNSKVKAEINTKNRSLGIKRNGPENLPTKAKLDREMNVNTKSRKKDEGNLDNCINKVKQEKTNIRSVSTKSRNLDKNSPKKLYRKRKSNKKIKAEILAKKREGIEENNAQNRHKRKRRTKGRQEHSDEEGKEFVTLNKLQSNSKKRKLEPTSCLNNSKSSLKNRSAEGEKTLEPKRATIGSVKSAKISRGVPATPKPSTAEVSEPRKKKRLKEQGGVPKKLEAKPSGITSTKSHEIVKQPTRKGTIEKTSNVSHPSMKRAAADVESDTSAPSKNPKARRKRKRRCGDADRLMAGEERETNSKTVADAEVLADSSSKSVVDAKEVHRLDENDSDAAPSDEVFRSENVKDGEMFTAEENEQFNRMLQKEAKKEKVQSLISNLSKRSNQKVRATAKPAQFESKLVYSEASKLIEGLYASKCSLTAQETDVGRPPCHTEELLTEEEDDPSDLEVIYATIKRDANMNQLASIKLEQPDDENEDHNKENRNSRNLQQQKYQNFMKDIQKSEVNKSLNFVKNVFGIYESKPTSAAIYSSDDPLVIYDGKPDVGRASTKSSSLPRSKESPFGSERVTRESIQIRSDRTKAIKVSDVGGASDCSLQAQGTPFGVADDDVARTSISSAPVDSNDSLDSSSDNALEVFKEAPNDDSVGNQSLTLQLNDSTGSTEENDLNESNQLMGSETDVATESESTKDRMNRSAADDDETAPINEHNDVTGIFSSSCTANEKESVSDESESLLDSAEAKKSDELCPVKSSSMVTAKGQSESPESDGTEELQLSRMDGKSGDSVDELSEPNERPTAEAPSLVSDSRDNGVLAPTSDENGLACKKVLTFDSEIEIEVAGAAVPPSKMKRRSTSSRVLTKSPKETESVAGEDDTVIGGRTRGLKRSPGTVAEEASVRSNNNSINYSSPRKSKSLKETPSGESTVEDLTIQTPLKVARAALVNEVVISPGVSDEDNSVSAANEGKTGDSSSLHAVSAAFDFESDSSEEEQVPEECLVESTDHKAERAAAAETGTSNLACRSPSTPKKQWAQVYEKSASDSKREKEPAPLSPKSKNRKSPTNKNVENLSNGELETEVNMKAYLTAIKQKTPLTETKTKSNASQSASKLKTPVSEKKTEKNASRSASKQKTPVVEKTKGNASQSASKTKTPVSEKTEKNASKQKTPVVEKTKGNASKTKTPVSEKTEKNASKQKTPVVEKTKGNASQSASKTKTPVSEKTEKNASKQKTPVVEKTKGNTSRSACKPKTPVSESKNAYGSASKRKTPLSETKNKEDSSQSTTKQNTPVAEKTKERSTPVTEKTTKKDFPQSASKLTPTNDKKRPQSASKQKTPVSEKTDEDSSQSATKPKTPVTEEIAKANSLPLASKPKSPVRGKTETKALQRASKQKTPVSEEGDSECLPKQKTPVAAKSPFSETAPLGSPGSSSGAPSTPRSANRAGWAFDPEASTSKSGLRAYNLRRVSGCFSPAKNVPASPGRRRASISSSSGVAESVASPDKRAKSVLPDVPSPAHALSSPARRRRSIAVGNLTPVRRSKRLMGLPEESDE